MPQSARLSAGAGGSNGYLGNAQMNCYIFSVSQIGRKVVFRNYDNFPFTLTLMEIKGASIFSLASLSPETYQAEIEWSNIQKFYDNFPPTLTLKRKKSWFRNYDNFPSTLTLMEIKGASNFSAASLPPETYQAKIIIHWSKKY